VKPGPGLAGLERANLEARTLATLQRGSWSSPDVLLVELGERRAVVKDFAPRSRLVRATFGRRQIRREAAIHRALADHPAVPALLGRLDAHALVVEHRPGPRLSLRRPWTFTPQFIAELERAVAGLHERGVVHGDLAHRSNVRASPSGSPVLIDFDAAWRFRPGGWLYRWLLPLAKRIDERGLAKWARALQSSVEGSNDGSESETSRGDSRPM
jgi:serine/threonine protein kinase